MPFPTELSNVLPGTTEIVAAHINNLEAKVGIDNSAVATSLDYLLKNPGSVDPGHKHTAGALSGGNNGEVFYKAAGVWVPGTPDAAGLVAKNGDQSIAGVKTFTSIPLGPASNPTTANQLARKAYVDLMLPLAGGTMAGNVAMNNHKLTGLAAASGTGEAVRYDEWIATCDVRVSDAGVGTKTIAGIFGRIEADISTTTREAGIVFSDANNQAFTGGITGIRLNSAGNFLGGLGFYVNTTSGSPAASFSDMTRAMTIDHTGYVGIGVTSPPSPLSVSSGIVNKVWIQNSDFVSGSIGSGISIYANAASGNTFFNIQTYMNGANGAGNLSLQPAGGNVGIGTTNPGYKVTCNGEPGANGYTAWTNYSDIRFKQDITPLNRDILTKILQLNPVTFSYNNKNPWGEKSGERTLYGFIAQELQELFPDMVGEAQGPDGEKYLTTNLSNLSLYLVQAIKEQQSQIEALQTKLN